MEPTWSAHRLVDWHCVGDRKKNSPGHSETGEFDRLVAVKFPWAFIPFSPSFSP